MRITHVHFKALYNLGNYNNETIGLQAAIEEGENPDEVLASLREKAIALNAGNRGDASELYSNIYKYKRALADLESRIKTATEQWNATAAFLKAQGINPDAPSLDLPPLLTASPATEEAFIEPDIDDMCF